MGVQNNFVSLCVFISEISLTLVNTVQKIQNFYFKFIVTISGRIQWWRQKEIIKEVLTSLELNSILSEQFPLSRGGQYTTFVSDSNGSISLIEICLN